MTIEIRQHTVRANGIRFSVLEAGAAPGEGELVFCIHGYPDTPHAFEPVMRALAADGFRVVAPFTRGYAPTEQPSGGSYSPLDLGKDVLALIEALGETRAHVVGHDWGASATFTAHGLDPSKFITLTTMAIPHPRALKPTLSLAWGARHFMAYQLPGAAGRVRKDDFAHIEAIYRRWSPTWDLQPSDLAHVKACFAQEGSVEAALGYYRAFVRGAASASGREAQRVSSKRITVPSIAFCGADDGALDPSAFHGADKYYEDSYDVIVVEGAGHFVASEKPDVVSAELLKFLNAHRVV